MVRQEARTAVLGTELDWETEMVKLKPLYPPTSSSGPDTNNSLSLLAEREISSRPCAPSPQREEILAMSW